MKMVPFRQTHRGLSIFLKEHQWAVHLVMRKFSFCIFLFLFLFLYPALLLQPLAPSFPLQKSKRYMTSTDLKVLIVGGGIAGLTLAVLLEKASIDFQVYERAAVVRPLGSVVAIGPNVLALIEQIGLLDQFATAAKVSGFVTNFNEQRQQTSYFDYRELKERLDPTLCLFCALIKTVSRKENEKTSLQR